MVKQWLELGDLVQINGAALADDNIFHSGNRIQVEDNGYLWIVTKVGTYNYAEAAERDVDPDDLPDPADPYEARYECKSLATGSLATWIRSEINAVEPNDAWGW